MGLNAKNKEFNGGNKKAIDPVEPGTYPARLAQVIDLGVQEQRPFGNEEAKPPVQEIMVTYELVDEFLLDDDGNELEDKPRWISETFPLYNLHSDLAKSTKRYYALDPKCVYDGDWSQLLGSPVMVTIVNNPGKGKNEGKVFEKITSTSAVREKEAKKLPDLKNDGKVFDLSDADTLDILLTLPQWIQDKIKSGLEFEGTAVANALEAREAGGKPVKKAAPKKQVKEPEPEDDDVPFDQDDENGEDW